MTSKEIRQAFLDFFASKKHDIVPSAPVVVKNDPTLMFNNAGMNQFKDYFLGNKDPKNPRVADTQKCLRVSGKHNDLEEVGVDTYHHTLFEMLGNWSFGDYFKKEAIAWAWEFLTEELKIDKGRIYVSVFAGDEEMGLSLDQEAFDLWKAYLPAERILEFDRKDNFWEMGDVGPCGPCSEIHVDMRSDEERAAVDGLELVNADHPQVIEIWNLVFIQYNRMANGSLEKLKNSHVDTGMGFERLCMVMQNKASTYDTDVFTPLIRKIESITAAKYGQEESIDIALRVIADHCRAITFTIADGQLPSNTGAGYVIRRILRRAVRYAYSTLDYKEPLLYQLVPVLVEEFGAVFPELPAGKDFLSKVIMEEENSFLRTLEGGLKRFAQLHSDMEKSGTKEIAGPIAFELYDTYGFPKDLTQLMAREVGLTVDMKGFDQALEAQKERSRSAGSIESADWVTVHEGNEQEFVGYDEYESEARLMRYRKVKAKKKESYQIVLDRTPFYAESGGQVGDKGVMIIDGSEVPVFDTKKENDLIVHSVLKLPEITDGKVVAKINVPRRNSTNKNHTGTHLLHAALKQVLGDHVNQKGSLVHPDHLRFDFSHFSKVSDEELAEVEKIVNAKVRENIPLEESRFTPYEEAIKMGATALFGEKYGDHVRVITFDKDFSRELCGGTHVKATGEIGFFKISAESSVAAGVRRIEALSGAKAEAYINDALASIKEVKSLFKNPKDVAKAVAAAVEENNELRKQLESMQMAQAAQITASIRDTAEDLGGVKYISKRLKVSDAAMIKKIAFDLKREISSLVLVLGAEINGKAHITIMIDDELVKSRSMNANEMIRSIASHIQGGGGGQPFYASAGGKNPDGLDKALSEARSLVESIAI